MDIIDHPSLFDGKVCRTCGRWKELAAFSKRAALPDGLQYSCKECNKASARRNYEVNGDRILAKNAEWHAAHPDYARQWNKDHPESTRNRPPGFYQRRYLKYREKLLARSKKWARDNPERVREQYRQRRDRMSPEERSAWAKANPLKRAENQARRRANHRNAPQIEKIDRAAIIERDHATCYLWCGRELLPDEITLDHVIPLVRGGSHTANNLRVACRSCNSRKGDRLLEAY